MTLRDVYFPTVWGVFLRGGKEAFSTIAAWRTRVKGQRRVSVDCLQAGNVFERCVKDMFVICSTGGIVIYRTDAWKSPRLEGTAEHIREVPCDRARDVLSHVRAEAFDTAGFLGEGSPSRAIMCRGSFSGLVGSLIGNSHWMRASGCPNLVRVRDGQREQRTGPCVLAGYTSGTDMLWCRISGVPATETDRESAPITDEQTKPRIVDSGQEAEKRRVELVDAKQSSSVAGKQHMMGDTTGGERDGTWSQAGRWIDAGSDRCADFSEESLDQSMLCVDTGSHRELLTKYWEAEHESGVPFTVAESTWPDVSHGSHRTRSIKRSMVRCWKRVKRTLMRMHGTVASGGARNSTQGSGDVDTDARSVGKSRRCLDLADGRRTH